MSNYVRCHVIDCRHAYSHTTKGHMCGKCHQAGHGQVEHGNQKLIDDLKVFDEELPVQCQCTIFGCTTKQYHKTRAHQCQICYGSHSSTCCPLIIGHMADSKKVDYSEVECPQCRVMNKIPNNQKKVFGVSDRCCVCKDDEAPAEVFFPQCGHVCVCMLCCSQLTKN